MSAIVPGWSFGGHIRNPEEVQIRHRGGVIVAVEALKHGVWWAAQAVIPRRRKPRRRPR